MAQSRRQFLQTALTAAACAPLVPAMVARVTEPRYPLIDLNAIFERLYRVEGNRLHPSRQITFHGRRAGKTYLALRQVVDHCLTHPDSRVTVPCASGQARERMMAMFEPMVFNRHYATSVQVDEGRRWYWVPPDDGIGLSSRVDFVIRT